MVHQGCVFLLASSRAVPQLVRPCIHRSLVIVLNRLEVTKM